MAVVADCSVIIVATTAVAGCSAIIAATTVVAGCSAIIVATTVVASSSAAAVVGCSHGCTLARLPPAVHLSPFAAPRNRFAAPPSRPAALLSRPAAKQLRSLKAAVASKSFTVTRSSAANIKPLKASKLSSKAKPAPKPPAPATTCLRPPRPMAPATLRPLRSPSDLAPCGAFTQSSHDNFGLSADARSPQNEYNSAWGFFVGDLQIRSS